MIPKPIGPDIVRIEGLEKAYSGGVIALNGIDLSVQPGELVGLIGANGSGKSTLLKIVYGVLQADRGTLNVFGLHPYRDRAVVRSQTGYAGQEAALDPETRGWEMLHLFYALRRLPQRERTARLEELATEYDLRSFLDRRVGTYSGGQRQRLHLALETMHGPRLLLLDEPTSSLDPTARRDLWIRLAEWRNAGMSVLAATHDLPDVAAHCDRVVLLKGGRVLADDRPESLVRTHSPESDLADVYFRLSGVALEKEAVAARQRGRNRNRGGK